ncbi:hypothetical protein H0E87_023399 [Populus deltoides]|uniref:RING-type E3 ubiquitin transferase n=1 Tax=Populus deltoides TaxID=3696 RepID=A0A8T2XCC9_POPDE|nr:hypothetical protein H0E87_023399 [Populus deltoides]
MAEAGVLETMPRTMTKETELKKELEKLVKTILVEEDYRVEVTDEAMRILSVLKELKFKKSSKVVDNTVIPAEFICPISKKIMNDPVVLATGQIFQVFCTYGFFFRFCFKIAEALDLHDFILMEFLQVLDLAEVERGMYMSMFILLEFLWYVTPTDAIPQLLNPLSPGRANTHPDLQEDLITTIFNLSIHENNKQLFAENPHVIPLLVESVRSGTIETRRNAAAALFSLSSLDSNKLIIGKAGALKPLIGLLEEGHPPAMKDAALAIFNLCLVHENRVRAVQEGAVRVILKKIMDCILVDELLATLAILTSQQEAVQEMGLLGAVPCLIDIIRESSSERNKENCAAILHTICLNDRTKWRAVMEEEKANATLSILAEHGTSRAKRKANGILKILNRAASITHTL